MSAAQRLPEPSPLRAQRGGLATPTARMDIHTCQTRFWQLDNEQCFTSNETRLYFYWVNRFNAAFWPAEMAHTCRQVEADLRFDDKTHAKARKGLEARGLLFYAEGDKRTKARWSLVGSFPTNPRKGRNNSEESTPIAPQIPRIFSDENDRITPQMPRKNSDPYIEQTKTVLEQETQTQKKAGVGEDFSSPAPSQKITPPTPVAAPPAPAERAPLGTVAPCLAPGTPESKALATELAAAWHITEGKNPRRFGQFATFTRTLAAAGRLEELRRQFDAYTRYRKLRGLSPFGIEKYLGHELEGYADGEWCGCEWPDVLAEAQQQHAAKSTGFAPETAPAHAGGGPSNKQKKW